MLKGVAFFCAITGQVNFIGLDRRNWLFIFTGSMIRGKQSLYDSLFPSSVKDQSENKGKRNVFIEQRNDALACRYYYHAQIKRIRYDDCLLKLNQEFFLSPNVIVQCLTERTEFIKKLVVANATNSVLSRRYPHFRWN